MKPCSRGSPNGPPPGPVFGCFGLVTPEKRVPEVLRAFGRGLHHANASRATPVLERRLGRAPRVYTWPYGAHSSVGWQAIAAQTRDLYARLLQKRAAGLNP